jgi:hypothetical protein
MAKRSHSSGTGALALRLALAAALSGAACGWAPRGRVLIVGIDGATLRVAAPLLEAGRLPELARLAREGASGPLRSLVPILSPRIWNSVATGKTPERHGIVGFSRTEPSGAARLLSSRDRRVHALWNIASRAGLEVGVVNWWNTWPPERVRGVMVSDHLFPSEVEARRRISGAGGEAGGALVFPEEWHARLTALLVREETLPPTVGWSVPAGLPKWIDSELLARWPRQDAALVRFALEIEAELRPDLLMVLLSGIDRVSHFLWLGMEPPELYAEGLRAPPAERAAARTALEGYYAYTDALLGALLARYGPEDLVLVLSDHGFEAENDLPLLSGGHLSPAALEGVLFARGAGIPAGSSTAGTSVLDVTPTVLAWWGLPVALDMEGRIASFLRVPAPEPIASWDTQPVERLAPAGPGAEHALLEELRALGYLE